MAISKDLLEILVCPACKAPLELVDNDVLERKLKAVEAEQATTDEGAAPQAAPAGKKDKAAKAGAKS